MNLNRDRILDEMGLTPQWILREEPPVERRAKKLPQAAATSAQAAGVPVSQSPSPCFVSPRIAFLERIAEAGWGELLQSIVACSACGLCAERKQAVPGVGDENADWLFIGEGPGAEEDARGEPFVGQAGKLLDAMLAAIELKRGENVYIANAVKCRPPGNRTPEADEMAACKPYLKRQIGLLKPKLIVLLGKAAVHAVLGEDASLASLRGKTLSYSDGALTIPVIVTYHPAYLLRTLPDKSKAWEDLCRARTLMRTLKVDS